MSNFFYSRWTSFAGMLLCLSALIFAAYLQTRLGLLPCPLCVVQRILMALLGLTFLLGALYTPVERIFKRLHSLILLLFSALGALSAGRQVWLTLQPLQALTACSPTLEYMFKNLSFNQTFQAMLLGSGECGRVAYRLLNLSIPEWTLLVFAAFFIFGLMRFVCAKSERGL